MTTRSLAVDFGTSNTVAVTRDASGRTGEVLFDGSPMLPSAVFAQPDGELLTGRDALHSMRLAPQRFEPNPKLRVDDGAVLLGDAEVPVDRLFAAVLRRVTDETQWHAGGPVVLTHPAGWGRHRRAVLLAAAERAGLAAPRLVPEPVAAAHHLARRPDPTAGPTVVYDLGAGTADVSVVSDGTVLAAEGLTDAGGLDVDAAIIAHLAASYRERDPAGWDKLRQPTTAGDRRARQQLAEDVRTAREMLSRTAQTFIPIPLLDLDAPLGRDELERIAEPLLLRTIEATTGALAAAGVPTPPPGPVLLVGGASRMPLVATLLHRHLRATPTLADRPDLAVAHGALLLAGPPTSLAEAPTSAADAPPPPPPVTAAAPTDATAPAPVAADRPTAMPAPAPTAPTAARTGSDGATPTGRSSGSPPAGHGAPPDSVTYTTTRGARAAEGAAAGGKALVVILLALWLIPLISGQWDQFHGDQLTDNLATSILGVIGGSALGATAFALLPIRLLTVGPDALTVERPRRSGAEVVVSLPVESIDRVTVSTKLGPRVVVWCHESPPGFAELDGHPTKLDEQLPGGGVQLCDLKRVTTFDDQDSDVERITAAIKEVTGERYVEP